MKKYIIWAILFIFVFFIFQIINVWNIEVKKWNYIIKSWDTLTQIPDRFNLKVNRTLYKLWLKIDSPNIKLQAWNYPVSSTTTLSDLLSDKLNKPLAEEDEITILPWWNIYDIDEYLSSKWIIKSWELTTYSSNIPSTLKSKYPFLKWFDSLEWFLYPDTYRLNKNSGIENIVWVLLDEFNTKIISKYNISWETLYKKMIMASIIQKEERNKENQPIVAWILYKRLNEDIALWADATVCYSYKLTQSDCTSKFIWTVIFKQTNYNTRSKLWLIPTPISNFTQDTFSASYNPQSSDYYYYLHDNDWYIHYAKTLDEHVRNKNLYLR